MERLEGPRPVPHHRPGHGLADLFQHIGRAREEELDGFAHFKPRMEVRREKDRRRQRILLCRIVAKPVGGWQAEAPN